MSFESFADLADLEWNEECEWCLSSSEHPGENISSRLLTFADVLIISFIRGLFDVTTGLPTTFFRRTGLQALGLGLILHPSRPRELLLAGPSTEFAWAASTARIPSATCLFDLSSEPEGKELRSNSKRDVRTPIAARTLSAKGLDRFSTLPPRLISPLPSEPRTPRQLWNISSPGRSSAPAQLENTSTPKLFASLMVQARSISMTICSAMANLDGSNGSSSKGATDSHGRVFAGIG